ncbi:tRNA pseudouridine(55) synthase TruB [Nostocoides sp. F2B08]|uniref:tRNA pseudouridine(55) synthase TruB n=1 Tax=Nostocoides sp. F2B08 TaxID=2653936 RepID=UPI001D05947C|nr:tRNA pseudouridine(55) synthase TruB [Tetrasphaera sp. F2B08]
MSGPPDAPARPVPEGVLVVDKPIGWTSHDVVGRTRRLAHTRKVGHAGTLDPMATGVLVLGIGRATRLLTFLVGCDKDYTATVRLGQATLTDDAEGEVVAATGAAGLTSQQVARAVAALTGDIEQVPSAVSAIKVDGKRSYARVRAGEEVRLLPRPVTVSRFVVRSVSEIEVHGATVLDVDVEVTVSSGTYVRALARDLGESLGCGGHLAALRRTRVGGFGLDLAHTVEELVALVERGEGLPVLDLAAVARTSFAVREVDADEARALGHGARIPSLEPGRSEPIAAIGPDGRLVAMIDESRDRTRSHVVFAPATS